MSWSTFIWIHSILALSNLSIVSAIGCLEVITTPYPETSWEIPWIHVAFENASAVASGVEGALRAQGKEDTK